MTAVFKHRLFHWEEWDLNPILVKELRQAVRGRAVSSGLIALLIVMFLVSVFFLTGEGFVGAGSRLGARLFGHFLSVLTVVTFVLLPNYVGMRLAVERRKPDPDLMFFTPLSPIHIVKGKLFCGGYLALLFFSACMPFMVFTNLLRGIDLPTIFFILLCLFGAVCVAIQAAILVGALPLRDVAKAVLWIPFILGLLVACTVLIALLGMLAQIGVDGSAEFWTVCTVVFFIMIGVLAVLFLISVSLLTTGRGPKRGYWNEASTGGTTGTVQ